MAQYYRVFVSLVVALFFPFTSCQVADKADDVAPVKEKTVITVFTNQTGDKNAEALQAQAVGPDKAFTLNFYGTFDASNQPLAVRSITVQKSRSDTTVHLLLNAITNQLETVYTDVKGVKQPVVIKHGYVPGNPNVVRVGLYTYDWQTNTGTLRNETLFSKTNGVASQTPVFAPGRGTAVTGFGAVLVDVGLTLALTEGILYYLGSTTLTAAYGPAVLAAIAGAGPAFVVTVAAVALIIATLEAARADDLLPRDKAIPPGTPPTHPSTVPSPASLPGSACAGTSHTFTASMDAQGSILVSGVTGSSGPYSYAVNNQSFQSGEVFARNYPAGTYFIHVRDGKGCVSSQVRTFTRPPSPSNSIVAKWNADKETIFWRQPPSTQVINMLGSFTFESNGNVTQMRNGNIRHGTYVFNIQNMEIMTSWSNKPLKVLLLNSNELTLLDETDSSFSTRIELKKQ